jgi:hypothetical protein
VERNVVATFAASDGSRDSSNSLVYMKGATLMFTLIGLLLDVIFGGDNRRS